MKVFYIPESILKYLSDKYELAFYIQNLLKDKKIFYISDRLLNYRVDVCYSIYEKMHIPLKNMINLEKKEC